MKIQFLKRMGSSEHPVKEWRKELNALSEELGFEHIGIVSLPAELRQKYFKEWLEKGWHGEMHWMQRDPERRSDPQKVLPEAKSIICFGLNYLQEHPERRGRIAKYALGKDYHKIILKKLKTVCRWLQTLGGINRPYVDTGPLLEKPIAALSGVGWQGKNTVVLNPTSGQWLFLGFILTSIEFDPDEPAKDRCGSCSRCIDVCPTHAIPSPYQLDSRKCIAYLTIEYKGIIPEEMRPLIGDHLFGCDDCLDVCPWNKWARKTNESKFEARSLPDLRDMLVWEEDTFTTTFSGTPIKRLGLNSWKRNICIVLGNIGVTEDLPILNQIKKHPDEIIRVHASWAINEILVRENQAGCSPM